jgi:hypothetical protein
MICTNLCKLIDGIDIKPTFAVVFDLKPCTFFLNTGKMFSIQTGINDPTEMKKKYGFFFENYTANKTNCSFKSKTTANAGLMSIPSINLHKFVQIM